MTAPSPAPLLLASSAPPWDWRNSASCTQTDLQVFFPPCGTVPTAARRACRACPVQGECLEDALNRGARHGIRAGMSATERAPLHDAREARLLAAGLKICVICAVPRPLGEFDRHGGPHGEFRVKCRDCLRVMPEGRAVANAG